MELYKEWLHTWPDLARDLHRVKGGHDKIKALAAELEAPLEDTFDSDWGEELPPLTPEEQAAEEKEARVGDIATLAREATALLKAWELEQITPTAARGLAAMANNPKIYPRIEILPAFGPEDVNDILRDWVELHPEEMEQRWDEDGIGVWVESTLIPLQDYAAKNGKDPATARQKAQRGGFATAKKVGRQWFISSTEPWPDHRRG